MSYKTIHFFFNKNIANIIFLYGQDSKKDLLAHIVFHVKYKKIISDIKILNTVKIMNRYSATHIKYIIMDIKKLKKVQNHI